MVIWIAVLPERLLAANPMLLLGAVHLPPLISVSMASAIGAWIVWYWFRLGSANVPRSRRRIRRYSLFAIGVSLMFFVRGLSFVDRAVDPRNYIITWSLALLMAAIVIVIAMLDAMNNLRLHQAHASAEVKQSTRELVDAIEKRRTASRASPLHEPMNGKRKRS
jgi:hypothetical protein